MMTITITTTCVCALRGLAHLGLTATVKAGTQAIVVKDNRSCWVVKLPSGAEAFVQKRFCK